MKFRLVETISNGQRQKNKKLKRLLHKFGVDGSTYVVHHLDSGIISSVGQLMDNNLNNILFLPKTPSGDSNAVHQLIHAAANFGGYDEFLKFICELNQLVEQPIYTLRKNDDGELDMIAIRISDAIDMTIRKGG